MKTKIKKYWENELFSLLLSFLILVVLPPILMMIGLKTSGAVSLDLRQHPALLLWVFCCLLFLFHSVFAIVGFFQLILVGNENRESLCNNVFAYALITCMLVLFGIVTIIPFLRVFGLMIGVQFPF